MFDRAYVILSILKLFCLYLGDFVYTKKISSGSCTLMVKLLLTVQHVWLAYVICQNWNGFIYTEMIFFYIEMILSTLKWFIYSRLWNKRSPLNKCSPWNSPKTRGHVEHLIYSLWVWLSKRRQKIMFTYDFGGFLKVTTFL